MSGNGAHGQDIPPTHRDPAQKRSVEEKRQELMERADDRISDGEQPDFSTLYDYGGFSRERVQELEEQHSTGDSR